MHRPQHLVGHIGGPGDGQKFPARANGHCYTSLCREDGLEVVSSFTRRRSPRKARKTQVWSGLLF
jgi:hypothetical protein